MLKNKKALVLLFFYLFLTTAWYQLQPQKVTGDSLRLFFQDPNIKDRIRDETVFDRSDNSLIITRVYHNKIVESSQVFLTNTYRAVDIPFLFSLTPMSTLYDDQGRIQMMVPLELPFFLLACWHLIRHWGNYKRAYGFLIPLLLASIFIAGLFYPPQNTLKLLPLVVAIRLITFIGMYEFITHSRWVKKLHLS